MSSVASNPISIHINPQLHHLAIPLQKFLENNPRYKTLAVGALIFSAQPHQSIPVRLLLVQRAATERGFPNLWEIPGGACEPEDPTILHSVAREVFEETGLHLTKLVRQVGNGVEFLTGSGGQRNPWIKLSFEIEVLEIPCTAKHVQVDNDKSDGLTGQAASDSVKVILDPSEHQAFRWVSEQELREQAVCFLNSEDDKVGTNMTLSTTGSGSLRLVSTDQLKLMLDAFSLREENGLHGKTH